MKRDGSSMLRVEAELDLNTPKMNTLNAGNDWFI